MGNGIYEKKIDTVVGLPAPAQNLKNKYYKRKHRQLPHSCTKITYTTVTSNAVLPVYNNIGHILIFTILFSFTSTITVLNKKTEHQNLTK